MKVKTRQRGAGNSSAQNHKATQSGQKQFEHQSNESPDASLFFGRDDGCTSIGAPSATSSAASINTPRCASATQAQTSTPSVVAAAASRPPLVIGTTSAAARITTPSHALTQQQLRKQRQHHRVALPPVRARGAASTSARKPRDGAWPSATSAVASSAAAGKSVNSAAALDEAVKAVERALADGPAGQQRLLALSVEQPDIYSQVILALFRKTQSLELISQMPMPRMPEPDFMLDPPDPSADLDFALGWDEGEDGDELDYWESMAAAEMFKGAGYDMYDMPYDLDGSYVPFPEPPFPNFDYDPGFDDDEEEGVYSDEYYDDDDDDDDGGGGGDDDDDVEEDAVVAEVNAGGEGLGYLDEPVLVTGPGEIYLDSEEVLMEGADSKSCGTIPHASVTTTGVDDSLPATHGSGGHCVRPLSFTPTIHTNTAPYADVYENEEKLVQGLGDLRLGSRPPQPSPVL